MREDFYLTLLSNSSFNFYPENKTANFKARLGREISLEGDLKRWKVCLCDMMYPNTFLNVNIGSNSVRVTQILDDPDCATILNNFFMLDNTVDGITDRSSRTACDNGDVLISQQNESSNSGDRREMNVFKEVDVTFPTGRYASIEEIFKAINHSFSERFATNLFSESLTIDRRVELAVNVDSICAVMETQPRSTTVYNREEEVVVAAKGIYIHINGRLASQLGFQPNENILQHKTSQTQPNIDAGIPSEMLVYVDVIEPQHISDSFTQLLKISKTMEKGTASGEIVTREFFNRCYLPVNKKRFQEIAI